ncbi:hypothetical protein BU16DRAFT_536273 [Lophium mytilinum]|uniref:RNase H type-1 domain-containing protein n=1 Tax=Lophium mytilinum TaxID=390894 RepID=A0A6A6R361_9PEZI|nr:hypothetical protein BU16DRAFT_536273 [Lophium mytilinum]
MDDNRDPSGADEPAVPAPSLVGFAKYARGATDSSKVPWLARVAEKPVNFAATAPGFSFGVPPTPTSTPIQRLAENSPAAVGHAGFPTLSSSFARTLPAQLHPLPSLVTQAPLPSFSSLLSQHPTTLAHPLLTFPPLLLPHPDTLGRQLPQHPAQNAPIPVLHPLLPLFTPTPGGRTRGEEATRATPRDEDQKKAQRGRDKQRRELKLARRHADQAGFHAASPTKRAEIPHKDQKRASRKVTGPARSAHRARMSAFHKAIMGRKGRKERSFAGEVVREDRRASVATSITYEDALPHNRTHNAFWTDGSAHHPPDSTDSFLGAAVARLAPTTTIFDVTEYPIGCNVGSSGDAEVYAIAAALGLAVIDAYAGKRAPVVIFTDFLPCLIALESGRATDLGPLTSTRWALEDIYDAADQLHAMGVPLTLRWVNGHSSAKGNQAADRGADRAARLAARAPKAAVDPVRLLPLALKDASRAWEEEY